MKNHAQQPCAIAASGAIQPHDRPKPLSIIFQHYDCTRFLNTRKYAQIHISIYMHTPMYISIYMYISLCLSLSLSFLSICFSAPQLYTTMARCLPVKAEPRLQPWSQESQESSQPEPTLCITVQRASSSSEYLVDAIYRKVGFCALYPYCGNLDPLKQPMCRWVAPTIPLFLVGVVWGLAWSPSPGPGSDTALQ